MQQLAWYCLVDCDQSRVGIALLLELPPSSACTASGASQFLPLLPKQAGCGGQEAGKGHSWDREGQSLCWDTVFSNTEWIGAGDRCLGTGWASACLEEVVRDCLGISWFSFILFFPLFIKPSLS